MASVLSVGWTYNQQRVHGMSALITCGYPKPSTLGMVGNLCHAHARLSALMSACPCLSPVQEFASRPHRGHEKVFLEKRPIFVVESRQHVACDIFVATSSCAFYWSSPTPHRIYLVESSNYTIPITQYFAGAQSLQRSAQSKDNPLILYEVILHHPHPHHRAPPAKRNRHPLAHHDQNHSDQFPERLCNNGRVPPHHGRFREGAAGAEPSPLGGYAISWDAVDARIMHIGEDSPFVLSAQLRRRRRRRICCQRRKHSASAASVLVAPRPRDDLQEPPVPGVECQGRFQITGPRDGG